MCWFVIIIVCDGLCIVCDGLCIVCDGLCIVCDVGCIYHNARKKCEYFNSANCARCFPRAVFPSHYFGAH